MQMLRYRPRTPLAAYVDCFWYARGFAPARRRERALPTGSADLIFNLEDDLLRVFADDRDVVGIGVREAVVHGPQSRYFVLDARRNTHVLGVHFRAGGASAVLGVPACELAERHLALEGLWGPRARALRERLVQLADPAAMFELLEAQFMRRSQAKLVHPVVSFALRGLHDIGGAGRIAGLQTRSGYGARRFSTLFTESVGLRPKLYSRIQRLRAVVEYAAREPDIDWAQIAIAHGYFDQSHLVRDFREFTGVTPAQYRPFPGRALHMELET